MGLKNMGCIEEFMEKRKEKSWDAYLVIDIKEKTGKEEIWKKRLTAKKEYVMMFRYENAEARLYGHSSHIPGFR